MLCVLWLALMVFLNLSSFEQMMLRTSPGHSGSTLLNGDAKDERLINVVEHIPSLTLQYEHPNSLDIL